MLRADFAAPNHLLKVPTGYCSSANCDYDNVDNVPSVQPLCGHLTWLPSVANSGVYDATCITKLHKWERGTIKGTGRLLRWPTYDSDHNRNENSSMWPEMSLYGINRVLIIIVVTALQQKRRSGAIEHLRQWQ